MFFKALYLVASKITKRVYLQNENRKLEFNVLI